MNKGFGMIEMLVAIGIWAVLVGSATMMVLGGLRTNRSADETATATHFAAEGIDAVNAIKRQGWTTPFLATTCTSGCGLATVSGTWGYSGANNVFGKFTRQVFVTAANRDGSGNIVSVGGTPDSDTYKVESKVTYSRGIPPVTNTISLVDYLTNYTKVNAKKGMLVYGNGGTTTDAMEYKTFDNDVWSSAGSLADVDGASTNKYARAIRVYDSTTRDEKIVVSRHYNGTGQWIYAQVFNGGTSTWGNVVQLSTWNATTFLDIQNFGGAYLANGDFVVVYSDNTSTPKMRVWNGSSWAAQTSLNAVTGTVLHTRLAARPGSNEMMAVFITSTDDVYSEYNNGVGYATANWTTPTTHATNFVTNTKRAFGFEWSVSSPLSGILMYSNQANDKKFTARVFVADGVGGGSWGASSNASNQTNNVGAELLVDRFGSNEMHACNKDGAASPTINCRKLTFSGSTITWSIPTNSQLSSAGDTGVQRNFGLGFETSGGLGVAIYSDNTSTPKLKKFTASTSTWDAAATNLTALTGIMVSGKANPYPNSDDILFVLGDASTPKRMYTVMWDGTNNAVYASPASLAMTTQATNGSANTDYWYDFVWDL